jgi:hypothetical protein
MTPQRTQPGFPHAGLYDLALIADTLIAPILMGTPAIAEALLLIAWVTYWFLCDSTMALGRGVACHQDRRRHHAQRPTTPIRGECATSQSCRYHRCSVRSKMRGLRAHVKPHRYAERLCDDGRKVSDS